MNQDERQLWLFGEQLAGVCGKKCGLITVTVLENEYIFQLNCLFCPNVLSCFDNFANHIKIKHSPILLENFKKGTDNENKSDRELPDELVSDNVSVSRDLKKEIKVESENEEAPNVSLSRELQENQSNDDAEFMSEDGEHSTETLSSVGPSKIVSKLSKGSPLNAKEVFEKLSTPILTSSRCQPVEESHHVNLSKDTTFHHPKNEIKLEYEETSNINNNQEHLRNELQENQSNDEAEFISEDDHSGESSHETSPKDSKMHKIWRVGDPKNRELALDIIKMWKSYPCLWDRKYHTKKKRDKTWDTIRQSLKKKWNFEIPKTILSRKICFLRTQYEQALLNRRKAATCNDVKVPWFFEELSFLEARTYYCKECDILFRSGDSFNHHKYTHDGIARYFCNVCNKEFPSARLLRQHNKRYHQTSSVGLSRVHLCNELQENHVNEDAELIPEDGEHSMETLSSVGPCKIEEFNVPELRKGRPNTKVVLEKMSTPIPTSSQCQPVQESAHLLYPKNEIKLEYKETSNVNLNQEHLCNKEENESKDCAEFLSKDEPSVSGVQESSRETSPKDSKEYKVWRTGDPKYREWDLHIIKMWKSYPCLWDSKCDDTDTQKKRKEIWDTIRHSLEQKWNCEIKRNTIYRKIRTLRTMYENEVRNRSKTTSKDITVSWFFEELSFLAPRTPRTYYDCEECSKVFRSEYSLNHHKCAHDGIALYVCNVCNTEFASVVLLKKHKKTIHGDLPFECKICGRKFFKRCGLNVHLGWHTKENSFACSECGKLYPTKSALKIHMSTKMVHSFTRQRRSKFSKLQ